MGTRIRHIQRSFADQGTAHSWSRPIRQHKWDLRSESAERDGLRSRTDPYSTEFTDATGFVAVDNTNKLVVISFRGTQSFENEVTDANYTRVESDLCPKCLVHEGFWFSWTEARNATLTALAVVSKQNPTYKVVVTGHSLGAALATFCVAEIRKMGFSASLVSTDAHSPAQMLMFMQFTFGSPRVGDSTTATFISGQSADNFRVTHYNDIVPHLPPLSVVGSSKSRRDLFSGFDFVHLSPEYYISQPTNTTVAVGDINTFLGLVSFKGNTGQAVPSIDAHRWYFNNISACAHL